MKIFISWSGKRSKAVAELMSDWLKCVIQASQPWISTRDIDRGAIWFSEINDKLKDTSVGVVCLTQENKNKPWILFETGALAKGLTTNRVCTFLIDLQTTDLQDPLGQFNHTTPDKSSVWELVRTINGCLNENSLDERILVQVFETYWPQFEMKFEKALDSTPPEEVVPPRSEQDILSEILNTTRSLTHRIRDLESQGNYKSNSSNINTRVAKNWFSGSVDDSWQRSLFDPNCLTSDVRKKVLNMIDTGQWGENELMKFLTDQDFKPSEAQKFAKNILTTRQLSNKNDSDSDNVQ